MMDEHNLTAINVLKFSSLQRFSFSQKMKKEGKMINKHRILRLINRLKFYDETLISSRLAHIMCNIFV